VVCMAVMLFVVVVHKRKLLLNLASTTMPPPPRRPPPPTTTYRPPRLSYNEFEYLEHSEESDLEDLFFTPNTSPRTSMASSLLMFPTGRKPSRKSLRLSDASDTIVLAAATTTTTTTTTQSPSSAVVSTRTPSTATSAHNRQRTLHALSTSSSLSSTSLEPHSVLSDESTHLVGARQSGLGKKAKEGTTKHTRHGSVTLKPSDVVVSSQTQSVKSTTTTTSKRKSSQQGLTAAKDVKRSVPPSASPASAPPPPASSTPNGSAVKATVTTTSTTASASIGSPHVLVSRKSSKTYANPGAPVSPKDKTIVVETEAPKTKEKEKEPHSLTPSSSKSGMKDKGKEKAKMTSTPTPITHHGTGDGDVVISERLGGIINISPKTTYTSPKPHTFSAFAPLATSSAASSAPSVKTNGNANGNNKPPLPPVGFSFPPPPLHSPQQQYSQQPKNALNGSAAAYTYAHRQKGSITPKPGGGGNGGGSSIMMNMAALLEEDELDVDGDGRTPARRLRHTSNANANVQGRGKGKRKKSFDSTSSRSDSSHHSHSGSPSRSNPNSNSYPTSNSNISASQTHSYSHSESSTFRSPPKTMASEVNAMSLSTPGDLPSKGTQGYTSLVLPRAPPPLGSHSSKTTTIGSSSTKKWFGSMGGGKIDLTRSGVAQTTMASVEVVRGLGRQQSQNGFGGMLLGMFGRKRSISSGRGDAGPRPIEGLGTAMDDTRTVNDDLQSKGKGPAGTESTVLGFTSYRKPPGYIPSSSVLVQVWAVGVDGVDGRLVGVKFGEHVWSRVRERGGTGVYEEESGVETEWEREVEENDVDMDVSKSTPLQNSGNRGLAGLGRSFSLRMSRTKQQQDHPQARRGRPQATTQQQPSRSFSLKRNNTSEQQNTLTTKTPLQKRQKVLEKRGKRVPHRAEVGYIPGRSFVGRVLECGWDVRDEVVRKGEWVVGLLDVKKVSWILRLTFFFFVRQVGIVFFL